MEDLRQFKHFHSTIILLFSVDEMNTQRIYRGKRDSDREGGRRMGRERGRERKAVTKERLCGFLVLVSQLLTSRIGYSSAGAKSM